MTETVFRLDAERPDALFCGFARFESNSRSRSSHTVRKIWRDFDSKRLYGIHYVERTTIQQDGKNANKHSPIVLFCNDFSLGRAFVGMKELFWKPISIPPTTIASKTASFHL
jgi:hypothetical protein